MSYLFSQKFLVDTNEQNFTLPQARQVIIYNSGTADIYVDDKSIDVNESFILQAGLSITLVCDVNTLYLQALSGSSTVNVMVIKMKKD